MEIKERNKRIYNLFNNKINYMFKEVLTEVEKESRKFDVGSDFFKKEVKNPSGFFAVRKKLFDHGNNILELLELILNEVDVTPTKAIINIDQNVIDQINKGQPYPDEKGKK